MIQSASSLTVEWGGCGRAASGHSLIRQQWTHAHGINRSALWLLVAMSQQHLTTGRVGTAHVGRAAAPGQCSPPLPFIPHIAPSQWVSTYTLGALRRRPTYKSTALQQNRLLMFTATAVTCARRQPSTGVGTERVRVGALNQHHTRVGSSRNCGRAAAAALGVLTV